MRILSLIFIIIHSLMVSGQSLVIKECIQHPTDLTASTKARIDNNGEYCALIKIDAPNINIIIQGNVIGDVEKFGSQYWCYVTNGTKQLVILSDECSSINVKFEDYGFYSVAGRRTYFVNIGTSDNIDISNESNDSTSIRSSHLGNSPYYSVIDSKKIPAKQAHNKCRTVILDDYAAMTLQKASEYNKKETGTKNALYFFQPFMLMGSFYFPMNSTKFIRKGNSYTISYEQLNERPITLQITFNPDSGTYSFVFINIDGEKYEREYSELKLSTQNELWQTKYSDKIYATTGNGHVSYPCLFDIIDHWHLKWPK